MAADVAPGADDLVIRAGGGPDLPPANVVAAATSPDLEEAAHELAGSPAGRLRARQAKLAKATSEFGLPGWHDETTGLYDLVLVAKPISDRKSLVAGMTNEQFIIASTVRVLARNESGDLQPLPDGWVSIGRDMGLADATLGTVVRQTLAVVDDDGVVSEVPHRVDALAEQILAFMMGRASVVEQALGE